ncbi:MAG: PHP domain-containing protein [Bacteroidota bacterium]
MADVVVDMHTHTTCSDGVLSPEALVEKAASRGLELLAITDHDTIDGIVPAMAAAKETGVTIMPGVELSIRFLGRELHLLGYDFDINNPELNAFLAHHQAQRTERAREMVRKLNGLGVDLAFEEVQAVAEGPAIGRPHVAQLLVSKRYVDTSEQAFIKYLRNGGPADVPKDLPGAEEAIAVLHKAGGIAVLAHPGHWVSDKDLERLQALGLDGVEVVHPSHDEMLRTFYIDVAHRLSLLTTGGSDFHGIRSNDEKNFGTIGFTDKQYQAFQSRRAA